MKFNFRKIASVIASAVMLGSTAGFALAANYPAPLISGGAADGAIVVTSGTHAGAISDFDAAISVQSALQGQVSSSTSTTTTTATGGDSINLATSSQRLYKGSALNAARTTLTSSEMPTVLNDGKATDNSGTEYTYTQKIVIGGRTVDFTRSGESIDPVVAVDIGSTIANYLYNYTLTLGKTLNVSSSDVIGYAEVTMMGKKYVVGSNSDYNTLYLYGAGEPVTVKGGETKTVTVDGTDHTVTLVTTSSSTAAKIEVDGIRKDVTAGKSTRFSGDIEVYIKSIVSPVVQGDPRDIEILFGSQTLHLESGQPIRYGSDDITIDKTLATISGTDGQGISSITISQVAKSSTGDYIEAGGEYTDRVFEGVKLQFATVNPALNSTARDSVIIDTDNAVAARVKFTSAIAGIEESTITYAIDTDRMSDTALAKVNLVDAANKTIHVVEGENAKMDELVVIHNPAKDEGRILKVGSIPGTSPNANDNVRLTDVLNTASYYDFKIGLLNTTSTSIDGETFYLFAKRTGDDTTATVNVTWGGGSLGGAPGTQTTLFPRIKLKNGEWMTFLTETTLTSGTTYQIPGEYLLSGYTTGQALYTAGVANDIATRIDKQVLEGNINYTIDTAASNASAIVWAVSMGSTNDCNFNSTIGPAILIMEEKTLANSNGYGICIPLTSEGTTTVMPAIGSPIFADGTSSLLGLASDTYRSQQVTTYGTLVERDTSDNNKVNVAYPDEQMYADILFAAPGTTVTPGSSTSGGGVISIVKDTEVDTVKDKNLLVVGGSCINAVARKIVDAGATSPICGADFTAKTQVGAGQYIIKAIVSPYNSAKTAILVAGYEAEETKLAVAKLRENHATGVGTSNIYPQTTA
ncbi:MAG: hypothetical protein NT076_04595 [Candidatus Pacearchaeota archaeon]|nr:hypothetical protein [Candidatus Pacearchaeota archaeon]